MRKELWADIGYAIMDDYCGLFSLDNSGNRILRTIFEDLALLRSYAAFEVMEAKGEIVFHFDDHFKRLVEGMTFLRMPIPAKIGKFFPELKKILKESVKETIYANGLKSSVVYVLVTGGRSDDLFHPSSPPNIFILVKPFSFPRFRPEKGLRLKTIDFKREFPNIKTTNYLAAEVSSFVSRATGYDDILYAPKGTILECSRSNFFIVKTLPNGRVTVNTSFLRDRNGIPFVLPGVTRQIVLELAKKMGFLTNESLILVSDLKEADEAFVVSTTKGIWPVVKIDKRDLPVGSIAMKLRKQYLRYRKDWYKRGA